MEEWEKMVLATYKRDRRNKEGDAQDKKFLAFQNFCIPVLAPSRAGSRGQIHHFILQSRPL